MSKKTSVNHSVVKKINSPPPIQIPYDPVLEAGMKVFYSNLSEKDRRYYVGLEAWKIFEGGVTYVSNLLECSRTTIYQGLEEVKKKIRYCRRIGFVKKGVAENHLLKNTQILMKYF